MQYNERCSYAEQEHSAKQLHTEVHRLAGSRYSLRRLLIRQTCTVVVGADAQNTTSTLKHVQSDAIIPHGLPLQFFPACARIHSEIYRGITPAEVVTTKYPDVVAKYTDSLFLVVATGPNVCV